EDGIRDRNVTGVQTCALPIFIDYQGQRYVIKDASASYDGLMYTKEITAHHIMYEFQNHFISRDITTEELNDDVSDEDVINIMTLPQYLDTLFKDNPLGYTYKIHGNFPDAKIGRAHV